MDLIKSRYKHGHPEYGLGYTISFLKGDMMSEEKIVDAILNQATCIHDFYINELTQEQVCKICGQRKSIPPEVPNKSDEMQAALAAGVSRTVYSDPPKQKEDPKDQEPTVLKLSLSRAALERLIGNEQHIELMFASVAIQQVLENHQGIIRSKVNKMVNKAIDEEIGVAHRVYEGGKYVEKIKPAGALAEPLRAAVSKMAKDMVNQYLRDNQQTIEDMMTTLVKDKIEEWVGTLVHQHVIKQIHRAIAVLKEPLPTNESIAQ